jgi:hypothetical protein
MVSSPEHEVSQLLSSGARDRSLLEMPAIASGSAAASADFTVAVGSAPSFNPPGALQSEAAPLEWDDAEFPQVHDLLTLLRTRTRSSQV